MRPCIYRSPRGGGTVIVIRSHYANGMPAWARSISFIRGALRYDSLAGNQLCRLNGITAHGVLIYRYRGTSQLVVGIWRAEYGNRRAASTSICLHGAPGCPSRNTGGRGPSCRSLGAAIQYRSQGTRRLRGTASKLPQQRRPALICPSEWGTGPRAAFWDPVGVQNCRLYFVFSAAPPRHARISE